MKKRKNGRTLHFRRWHTSCSLSPARVMAVAAYGDLSGVPAGRVQQSLGCRRKAHSMRHCTGRRKESAQPVSALVKARLACHYAERRSFGTPVTSRARSPQVSPHDRRSSHAARSAQVCFFICSRFLRRTHSPRTGSVVTRARAVHPTSCSREFAPNKGFGRMDVVQQASAPVCGLTGR